MGDGPDRQHDARGYFVAGNKGGPGGKPTSFTQVARKVVDPKKLVDIFWAMAQGLPEIRYKDSAGQPVEDPSKYTGDTPLQREVIYPTIAERQAAARWLWDRVEPKEMKLKLEIANRPAIMPSGAALDAYIEAREKLQLMERGGAEDPGVIDADVVEEKP